MAKTGYSAVKQVVAPYWYKIGGKSVSKAKYNAYNNPVGDGPTKSTNDPDASGNKAKIEKSRSTNEASKRPTVLTKKQTELKNQGTKLSKKPPLKQKSTLDPKVLAMMQKRGIPTPKQNNKGGSGYLTTKGSVANDNGVGERKRTIAEKMEGVADKITANAGGGPTQFLAEATGIPSLMRLPKSYSRVAEDPSGKNLLAAGVNTLGVLPGVTGLAKGASKFVPQAAKYIDPTVSLLNKVNKSRITKSLKKGKKAKVIAEKVIAPTA